jgi:nucleoid-associated protein YgaU
MATIAAAPVVSPRRTAAARPSAPVRLTHRGRLVLALALALVAGLAVLGLGLGGASAVRGTGGPVTTTVVVQPGETLWQIAQRVAPGADPRLTVDRLQRLNGLDGALVVPGQELVVPIAG